MSYDNYSGYGVIGEESEEFVFSVVWTHGAMMCGWVMLGKIVCLVVFPRSPVNVKLTLTNSVANPVEAHVNSFRALLLDAVIGNPSSRAVVRLNRSRAVAGDD